MDFVSNLPKISGAVARRRLFNLLDKVGRRRHVLILGPQEKGLRYLDALTMLSDSLPRQVTLGLALTCFYLKKVPAAMDYLHQGMEKAIGNGYLFFFATQQPNPCPRLDSFG